MTSRKSRASAQSRSSRTTAIRTRRLALRASRSIATRARVIVRAEPGTIGLFGPVDIAGNRRVDDRDHPQAAGVRAWRSVPAKRDRADAAAHRRARPLQIGRDPRAEHRPSAGGGAHAHYGRRTNAVAVESRTGLCSGRAPGCRRAHQPSERVRVGRAGSICRAVSRASSAPQRLAFTQTDAWHPALVALAAGAAPGDRRALVLRACRAAARRPSVAVDAGQFARRSPTRRRSSGAMSMRASIRCSGLQDGMLSAWSIDLDHRRAPVGRCAADANDVAAHRTGRRVDAWHVQLLQPRWRCPPLPARCSADRVVFASRASATDRSIPRAATPTFRCSRDFFSAARTRCADGASSS